MATWNVRGVELRGAVAAVPERVRSVGELGVGFTDEERARIASAVGLSTLRRVAGKTTAGELCGRSAERLLERLGWEPGSVAGIVVVTQTPDRLLPGNASYAHGRLGLPSSSFAFDISLGCSGFVYALAVVSRMMGPENRRVLVLAGDTLSRLLDPADKATSLLFGDAGGAVALEWSEGSERRTSFVLGADGSGVESLKVEGMGFGPGGEARSGHDAGRPGTLSMDGIAIFNFTIREVPKSIREVCASHGWVVQEPSLILLHQANAMIASLIAKKLTVPLERFPSNIGRFGNTSVASLPLLLADAEAVRLEGSPVPIVMAGFGVGLSWASAACEIPAGFVQEILVVEEGA